MKLFGGILMAIGILVAGLSGLCSLILIGGSISSVTSSDILPGLLVVGLVGGIPFAGGIALFIAGRAMARNASRNAPNNRPEHRDPSARPAHRLDDDAEA